VTFLKSTIESWISEQGYSVPVTWDGRAGQLIIGNPEGKTRARFTTAEIESERGPDKCLESAKETIENWKRLRNNKAVYDGLPRGNRKDLGNFFA